MNRNIALARILAAPCLLWLAMLPAHAIQISLTQSGIPPESLLTIEQVELGPPDIVAFESMGAVLADRIELRYAAGLEIVMGDIQSGWTFQSSLVTETGMEEVGLSTFFFSGLDGSNSMEYFSFLDPWSAAFSFTDSSGGAPPDEIHLEIDVFASAIYPGSGLISVNSGEDFMMSASFPVSDGGGSLLLMALGLGGVVVCRANREVIS